MIESALLSTMVASSVMQVALQERTTNTCQTCADVAEYFRILSASQVEPRTHRAKMTAQVAATTSVDLDRQALENGTAISAAAAFRLQCGKQKQRTRALPRSQSAATNGREGASAAVKAQDRQTLVPKDEHAQVEHDEAYNPGELRYLGQQRRLARSVQQAEQAVRDAQARLDALERKPDCKPDCKPKRKQRGNTVVQTSDEEADQDAEDPKFFLADFPHLNKACVPCAVLTPAVRVEARHRNFH